MQDQSFTPSESRRKVTGSSKTTTTDWEEVLGMLAALFMYLAWVLVYGAISGEKSGEFEVGTVVFLTVLSKFFMDYVPDLREDKLNWKVVTFGWLLLPIAWSAVAAALMGLFTRYVMPLLRDLLG